MNDKVLTTLEFHKIREMLAAQASSEGGKELCRSLAPYGTIEEIEHAETETADAFQRIVKNGSLSFSGIRDITKSLKHAEAGAVLSTTELLDIASFLEATKEVKTYGGDPSSEEYISDSLSDRFSCIESIDHTAKEIRRCILDADTIADDASSELKSIRRQIRNTQEKVHSTLSNMINGRISEYLMDRMIVMRDNRYCIPVRSEHKSQVPGIVHDQSGTGSTLFIEPQSVVNMNNQIRELEAAERDEIQSILRSLSFEAGQNAEIMNADYVILTELDLIFAKAGLALEMNAVRPVFNTGEIIRLRAARHPLIDPKEVVPIDLEIGESFDLLVVTGPNTGGKTVSLKTVGLLELMGLSGLHIPAGDRSELSFFREIYADIGDEQSIEQSLSTFSSHMTNIVEILKNANITCLCLFDELCAGTDPAEGAALAMAVLDHLHKRSIRTMATTHYPELKEYALSTSWVENACLEFDVESLRPTYRILVGVPGKSNAFAISKRLGLPDKIIDDAKKRINEEDEKFEQVLASLEENRITLEKKQKEISDTQEEIERLQSELDSGKQRLDEAKEKILSAAREEARSILKEAKETADLAIRNMQKYADSDTIRAAEKERTAIRKSLNSTLSPASDLTPSLSSTPEKDRPKGNLSRKQVKVGMNVRIISLNLKGVVQTLPDKDGNLSVQCGIIKYEVNISDLNAENMPRQGYGTGSITGGKKSLGHAKTIHPEINLIGMNSDDAREALSSYLDDAYVSHLSQVRIVHGKGSGILREAVRTYLKNCKYVKDFRDGEYGEGDSGVTVAVFKDQ
ncbi:MAG: endonuclease MutS2 [Lachnospiraceae bacterium]|nr:endonuclease MutS2 [Lachnospiraceae bacterium]